MVRLCGTAPYEGSRRVVRIWQAEKMNPAAQNALLKTLEEPPEGTYFLLTAESTRLLLPTVVSRCRELPLHAWPDSAIQEILRHQHVSEEHLDESVALSEGSPGRALQLAGDAAYWKRRDEVMQTMFGMKNRSVIAAVSLAWKERADEADQLLDDLEDMLHTLLMARLGKKVSVSAYPGEWQRMAQWGELKDFVRLQDDIVTARRRREAHVTWQAVLEQLLLRLMEEKSKWQT